MFNIFKKTWQSMERTRELWLERVGGIFSRSLIDDDLWDDLEEVLIAGDVGVNTSMKLIEGVKARVQTERVREGARIQALLGEEMISILKLKHEDEPFTSLKDGPAVVLVVGVNGTGKTTSIAKLAYSFKGQGKRVVLAAADTFRAAAIDQLKHWGDRLDIEVISSQPGGDPGAVVFDALEAARRRKADVLIADTAGRIQTRFNLMEELKKIRRVISRAGVDPVVLLVLDANTGQNGLSQAKYFAEAIGVDGVILAKLDSTSRGGIVLSIVDQLKIPILFIGTGQEPDDLAPFNADEFVESLLSR
ncbi:signal recognition particle-docking protein FtsY [Dehalococcoidia bacterium]|nr:signal recognition particle-docking protein FtsY [Dehalococcoidia bacterium]MCL0034633.1 signal recognition particle-docking protein FtsY [Dehalococcoidia bacterium]MCL0090512.1 signal recognition particle-docking protein FtsY [Dehalococcoidia bacterium]MCL0092570.1 signal recognition particle-docking protein FtsY [Dehalococcoidia bacterium]